MKLSLNKIKQYVKQQTHGGLSAHGLVSSVKGAAKNPLTYAAGALLLPGVAPMALNALKAGAGALASGAGSVASGAGGVGHAIASGVGKVAPMALSALDKLGGVADTGLGIAQLANAANLQRRSTDYATNAMNAVEQSYGDRAPLRVAGVEGLLRPKTPDLTSLRRTPGNPFGAPMPVGGG